MIPLVAYGATFYLHDRDGRMQFYKGFYSVGISKEWQE